MTRKFALIAGLIVLIAGTILSIVQFNHFQNYLRQITTGDHQVVSHVISNRLLKLAMPVLAHEARHTKAEHISQADFGVLDNETKAMIANTEVVKIKVLKPNGIIAYSTSADEIGQSYADNARFINALKSEKGGEYGFRPMFDGAHGKLENVWISSNYVIHRDPKTGAVNTVSEVYSDITHEREMAWTSAIENIAIAIVMLLVIYALLLVVVYTAVRMVRNEHRRAIALTAAMAQVEAASQSKSNFLANMSHELRTPLNAIIGFAEIMGSELKGPLGDPSYKSYAEDISKSGRNLLGIIDRVLDLVRAETGATLLDISPTDVNFICKSVARMLSPEARNASLYLSVTTSEDPLTINTDAGKLRDILVGLVSNSIRFTPAGGNISIRIDHEDKGARITITDDGIGISAEDMPAAIAPFGHVENVYSKKHGGVGLGLPLARKLTELLDGSFEVTSNPDQGTVVTIILPDRPSNFPANDASDPDTKKGSLA